jgi:hypothetical protein
MMRSIKISEQTDLELETLKLLTTKKLNVRISKGLLVAYALKAYKQVLDEKTKIKKDENNN